jgi:pre-mRNA-splicing factor RBM22/SLT11
LYQYGEIRNIHISERQQCAFVTFTNRSAAEHCVDSTFDKLIINGKCLDVFILFIFVPITARLQ